MRNQDFDDIKVLTPGIPAILSHTHAEPAQSTSATTVDLEWIADSGAGRDLESERAFLQQGIPKDTMQSCISGIHPTRFETGNGTFISHTCIELQGESFGQARFNMMNDCPLVRSLGQIVSSGKPFVWMPGECKFFANSCDDVQIAADESQIHHAQRVEDFVPVFVTGLTAEAADSDRFVDEGQG